MLDSTEKIVATIDEARNAARQWAAQNNANSARCEALAEVWLDAGKDPEQSTDQALRSYLTRKTSPG